MSENNFNSVTVLTPNGAQIQLVQHDQLIRIMLIDSIPITLYGLQALLTKHINCEIICANTPSGDIVKMVEQQKPDIALLDFHLLEHNSIELVRKIQNTNKGCIKTIIFSSNINENDTYSLIKCGIKGILPREINTPLIIQCILRVYAGGEWLDRDAVRQAFSFALKKEAEYQTLCRNLSSREISLVKLVAAGYKHKAAARKLNLSDGSTRVYLNRIYHKLGINNRQELISLLNKKQLAI